MIEKKNYYGIDLLKFIMAVCVVAIHTQPLYSVQSIVVQRLFDTITSLAVPYFFSVSGFLLFSKIDADISCRKNMEVCKRYLSRVLSLYVIWNIIYLPISSASCTIRQSVRRTIHSRLTGMRCWACCIRSRRAGAATKRN